MPTMSTNHSAVWIGSIGTAVILAPFLLLCLPVQLPSVHQTESLKVVDCNGILLREVFSPSRGRGTHVRLDDISREYLDVVVALEDKRFFSHVGIDPLSIARAAFDNLKAGRVVSGASTITQQLSRELCGFSGRAVVHKAIEAWHALRIDLRYSKERILECYLNRISFGNNNYGIEAASRFYLGKSAAHLTVAESALLATIPRGPTIHNPLRMNRWSLTARYRRTVQKLYRAGVIDSLEMARIAGVSPLVGVRRDVLKAPHFVNYVLSQPRPKRTRRLRTTLDYSLQQRVEEIVASWIERLSAYHVTNAAVVVLDNRTRGVKAWVGSKDFWDREHHGQVDGVRALRQPGSALKPFLYALALSSGYTAASVLADIKTNASGHGGDFVPHNYDRTFHGPVRLRRALACSYNVPAVRVLERLGTEPYLRLLRRCGFTDLLRPSSHYGLGLSLGNAEITLLQLVKAYSVLAGGGCLRPIIAVAAHGEESTTHRAVVDTACFRVFDSNLAFILTDILGDNRARTPAFGPLSALRLPFHCAVKTGTTKDYRDNWTVGYTQGFTVGVWVGNFDGSPMVDVSGVSGAAPIFHQTMMALEKRYGHEQEHPVLAEGLVRAPVCRLSGLRAGPWCEGTISELFLEGTEPSEVCGYHTCEGIVYPPVYGTWAARRGVPDTLRQGTQSADGTLRITFPGNGDIFKIDKVLDPTYQRLFCEAVVPARFDSVEVFVDGKRVARIGHPFRYELPLNEGEHVVEYRAGSRWEAMERVAFRVLP